LAGNLCKDGKVVVHSQHVGIKRLIARHAMLVIPDGRFCNAGTDVVIGGKHRTPSLDKELKQSGGSLRPAALSAEVPAAPRRSCRTEARRGGVREAVGMLLSRSL